MGSTSMDLPPISDADASRFRFLTPSGASIGGPAEWTPALLEVLVPHRDWEAIHLWLQGQELPVSLRRLGDYVRVIAEWPRSGTGQYRLQLQWQERVEEKIVTILPQKISLDAYQRLLEDLTTRLPAAVALGLQRLGGLTGIKLLPPAETTLATELVRLRRAVLGIPGRPGLVAVVKALAGDPHRMLQTQEYWVSQRLARKPHPSRLALAVTRRQQEETELDRRLILDRRVEHTADVYENRLVKAYVQQVSLRLRRLVRALEGSQQGALLAEAQGLLKQMQAAVRQASFLDEVSLLAYLPTQITMVLLKRPPYRAALEGYLELHRTAAVRLEEPALEAPLEQLPVLYQLWGTLEVLLVLVLVAAKSGYQVASQRLVGRDATGVYVRVLPDGEPVVILVHPEHGTRVLLIPERKYGKRGRLQNISYEQRPDVAVEIHPAHGAQWVLVFDPKYKLEGEVIEGIAPDGKPKKVDIDKMHAYRDAIRDEHGRRVVEYAAILYPGPDVRFDEGLEALSAVPGREQQLEERLAEVLTAALKGNTPRKGEQAAGLTGPEGL